MVVGHLTFMARLVSRLVAQSDDGTTVKYLPGSLVCLECDEDGVWVIAWMPRPELMAENPLRHSGPAGYSFIFPSELLAVFIGMRN